MSKKKTSFPNLKKKWFYYVTLPLFLFMTAYRIAECVIHNLLEEPNKKIEKKEPIPLSKSPVKTEAVPMEAAGKPIHKD